MATSTSTYRDVRPLALFFVLLLLLLSLVFADVDDDDDDDDDDEEEEEDDDDGEYWCIFLTLRLPMSDSRLAVRFRSYGLPTLAATAAAAAAAEAFASVTVCCSGLIIMLAVYDCLFRFVSLFVCLFVFVCFLVKVLFLSSLVFARRVHLLAVAFLVRCLFVALVGWDG